MWWDARKCGAGGAEPLYRAARVLLRSQDRSCGVQTLGGWLWPLPDAVNLGPVHSVLLKKLVLQSIGAAVAAFSLKVTPNLPYQRATRWKQHQQASCVSHCYLCWMPVMALADTLLCMSSPTS
jgi:hypothetical protein